MIFCSDRSHCLFSRYLWASGALFIIPGDSAMLAFSWSRLGSYGGVSFAHDAVGHHRAPELHSG